MLALMILPQALATSVPSLTFDELTDRSEVIVAGRITRSWSDWDSERKFIWTHYELSVSSVHKGAARTAVTVSEPGGVVGGRGMRIAGSVEYSPGDQVAVFLQRMPNGYLRTAGWGQGKYLVDKAGHLHAGSLPDRWCAGSKWWTRIAGTNPAWLPANRFARSRVSVSENFGPGYWRASRLSARGAQGNDASHLLLFCGSSFYALPLSGIAGS